MTGDLLLVLAMCTDSFFAALSYGVGKIKIPAVSAVIICLVGTAVLTFSMLISGVPEEFISPVACRIAGSIILGVVGVISFCQSSLKSLLRKRQRGGKVSFSLFNIGFVVNVFLDETAADADRSKTLSPKESLTLAVALSADSLAGGFGAGLSGTDITTTAILSFALGILSITAGGRLGQSLSRKAPDLSWISGIFLIILSLIKLLNI